MLATDGFALGEKNAVIAKRLRVTMRLVERWRRSWRGGGPCGRQALRSDRRSTTVTSPCSSHFCWKA
ncbi:helix-turn-helix domain-containing protein [Streptomyces sp. NPDC086549]|uniref:helix-turn-helix domain-containing protein n=1 Tax=Streptomyces sp. NPDC086549 TaxID=3365752 RepID=UPI003805C6A9